MFREVSLRDYEPIRVGDIAIGEDGSREVVEGWADSFPTKESFIKSGKKLTGSSENIVDVKTIIYGSAKDDIKNIVSTALFIQILKLLSFWFKNSVAVADYPEQHQEISRKRSDIETVLDEYSEYLRKEEGDEDE